MLKTINCILLGGALLWSHVGAAADFDTAYQAYRAGDYREAAREFKYLAHSGHVRAQYLLGLLYVNGQGVEQAPEQGVDWLKRAAENGYYLAAAELGQIYASGRGVAMDSEEAAKWIGLSDRLATEADAEQECE